MQVSQIEAFIKSDLSEKAQEDPLDSGAVITVQSVECVKDDDRHATCIVSLSGEGETVQRSAHVTYDPDTGEALYKVDTS